ncbi:A24 family peptidase [Nocardioides sp. REDSEA-S30_B4]|uniref:prepilin peptidase n=1 Tax=Nocardioides sp. REDSEA-S30_B4 TaxID=1811552 RepID=UPI000B263665|nr:A24 family peptidase [Nocardioides sp. REDSEA-S30_B4]
MSSPLGALVGALVGGALCLAVPWLVARTSEVPRGRRLLPGAVLAGTVAGGSAGAALDSGWALAAVLLATPACVALAFVDWHTRLLPSRIVLPATGAVLALLAVEWAVTGDHDAPLRALIGLVVARSIYWVLWFVHSAGMGFGDVRLAALLGAVLGRAGWSELVVGTYAPFLLFAVPGLLLALVRRDRSLLRAAYPFGPFMVVGALLGVLAGPALLGLITA